MMKFLLIALLAVCVSGFTMNSARSSRSITMMAEKSKSIPFLPAPKNTAGLIGDKGFDPLGFSNWIDIRFLQEAEIKHGRITMLAVAGWVFAEFVKLPGDVHQVTSAAAHDIFVKNGALVQVNILISALEFISVIAIKETLEGSGRQPGEFGFDPLKFSEGKSDAVKKDYQLKEIENGRLAMVAFAGIATQAVLTGKSFPYF
mmetsp:Transcript_24230/g.22034  ORF Transcript_24230/g.22034 Transcript_24230/m.22034 type:complete len:202 (+) Transcript_24230:44-649(+)